MEKNFQKDWKKKKIGGQQTFFMFILSDQIIILFPADTFLENSLFSVHITNMTSTNFWKNDHACQSEWVLHQPCQM